MLFRGFFVSQTHYQERNLMKLTDQLTEYVHAAYTGLWVHTQEPDEAEREILRHARQKKWKVAVWDVANGLRLDGGQSQDASDPLAVLRALPAWPRATARPCCFCTTFTASQQPRGHSDHLRPAHRRQAAADLRRRACPRSCRFPSSWRSSSSFSSTPCRTAPNWTASPVN